MLMPCLSSNGAKRRRVVKGRAMQGSTPNERSSPCGLHGGKECARKLSDAAPAQHFLIFSCCGIANGHVTRRSLESRLKQRQPVPPHAVYDGEFCDTLREARAAGAAPRTPYKKDGPAVNGCFQSIDEEAPNWQALIGTLVRIVFSSGVFAPMRRADSANPGARECEHAPHPRAV